MGKQKGGRMLDPVQKESRTDQTECSMCGKDLRVLPRALFVEEEVGRTFCCEECISEYYQDDIQVLEKKYLRLRGRDDLTGEERTRYSHLRWITLEEPDEIWCEKTASGELRYTLISEFKPESRKIWNVCICLFLKNEPSFLYLAFPTQKLSLVKKFRTGTKIERVRDERKGARGTAADRASRDEETSEGESPTQSPETLDRVAEDWTENEGLRAKLQHNKNAADIRMKDYGLFEHLADPTLETPDELWVQDGADGAEPDQYAFIRYFPNEGTEDVSGVWYIVTAQESEESEELELLTQIPTVDAKLVQKYRQGRSQQIVSQANDAQNRFIH